ncbi:MAG: TrkH family potassium uptake protein [Pirellulaceae bacterium]|nr:TrkH family potassium uptake protein [Pirellulaceae bacterium]
MNKQQAALSYRVRFHVLAWLLGRLSLIMAWLVAPLLAVTLWYGAYVPCGALAVLIAALLVAWFGLRRLPEPSRIQENESLVLAAGTFLGTSLVMLLPLKLAGLSSIDAWFEAVSGITTTGLSTCPRIESMPDWFLLARAWLQWCGGLGFVVFSLALVVRPGILAKGLAVAEAVEMTTWGGAAAYARRVLAVYLVLTAAAILVLLLAQGNLRDAVAYALSAVSTGGFAPHDASLAHFTRPYAPVVATLVGVAGSVPLIAYWRFCDTPWRVAAADLQLRAIVVANLIAIVSLVVCMGLVDGRSWSDCLYHGPLQAMSAQSTTGFSTLPASELSNASRLILIAAMLAGGGIGSTAGGVKVLRLLILWRVVRHMVRRTCLPPHAVLEPTLAGREINSPEIRSALAVALLFLALVGCSWLVFLAHGEEPLDSLFEVVSATATVGLSSGVTRPDLPAVLKCVLGLDMLLGRMEIFAWLVWLHRWTWFGKRAD